MAGVNRRGDPPSSLNKSDLRIAAVFKCKVLKRTISSGLANYGVELSTKICVDSTCWLPTYIRQSAVVERDLPGLSANLSSEGTLTVRFRDGKKYVVLILSRD